MHVWLSLDNCITCGQSHLYLEFIFNKHKCEQFPLFVPQGLNSTKQSKQKILHWLVMILIEGKDNHLLDEWEND